MVEIVLSTAVGIVFGGLISAWISRYYARKTSKESHEVAEDLRAATRRASLDVRDYLIGRMEQDGLLKITHTAGGTAKVHFNASLKTFRDWLENEMVLRDRRGSHEVWVPKKEEAEEGS